MDGGEPVSTVGVVDEVAAVNREGMLKSCVALRRRSSPDGGVEEIRPFRRQRAACHSEALHTPRWTPWTVGVEWPGKLWAWSNGTVAFRAWINRHGRCGV